LMAFLPLVLIGVLALGTGLGIARADDDALAAGIERVLSEQKLKGVQIGMCVVALPSGRVLYSRRAMQKFIVASNQKLLTAATALTELGSDYEFVTTLYASGKVREGRLEGDLIVRGGGDPTIGGKYEEQDALEVFGGWARSLARMGVQRISGDVVADDAFFDREHLHPDWPREEAWRPYCAPVSALSADDNCVRITCKPAQEEGAPAKVSLSPDISFLKVRNLCRTSQRRHLIWFHREAGSRVVSVGGRILLKSKGYGSEVTVPDPALYAAGLLAEALRREGIEVTGKARLIGEQDLSGRAGWQKLAERRAALLPALRVMLKHSHNLYAEQVIKTIGAEASGEGSWEAGLARAAKLLCTLGFNEEQFQLADGSGLSRKNCMPPALLVALLVHVAGSDFAQTFRDLLPGAGVDGTLSSRFKGNPYKGAIRAKTGHLYGVGALSGYATARSGLQVAFSILINEARNSRGNYSMRPIEDALCAAIVDHAR